MGPDLCRSWGVRETVRIRDPIHGTQRLSRDELAVVDHRAVQRLRGIKQLGLADLAYPGATHTRYAHALGVMHLAGRVFDAVTVDLDLSRADRERLRTALRLAALFHDLGHAPLSHSTEFLMPPVTDLSLGPWRPGKAGRTATHEDYTLGVVLRSDLSERIGQRMAEVQVGPEEVAGLLTDQPPPEHAAAYVVGGRDYRPFLRQCVSSELDVDRMDYLLRDSYFAGVPYGRFDLEWLTENLRIVERPGQDGSPRRLHLGLAARASFGFEDYLLSRLHMFLAVYLHHVPVGYELMLEGIADEGELRLPADIDAYLGWDDMHFFQRLRASSDPWARRIVERRGYRRLIEHKRQDEAPDPLGLGRIPLHDLQEALSEAGIQSRHHAVKSRLSKYFHAEQRAVDPDRVPHLPGLGPTREEAQSPPLFVVEDDRAVPLEEHVALYRRYRSEVSLERVYVPPEQLDEARALLARLTRATENPTR